MQALRSVVCPACQLSQKGALSSQFKSYRIYECSACGLGFSDPMDAADSDFYATFEDYDDKWEFEVVANELRTMPRGLRVLDIGCGDGRFLQRLSSLHHVIGVDFNPRAIQAAREKGLEVHALSLDEYRAQFPGNEHDFITLFHVLEHVSDPAQFIEALKKSLRAHGRVGISVPNQSRWTLSLVREIWDYPPHHLTRWSADALRSFLCRHGFEVVETCAEPVHTWHQVHDGISDVVWSVVLKNFSLGVATKLSSASGAPAARVKSARVVVARFLSMMKSRMLSLLIWMLTAVCYPYFRIKGREGKSLLVLARLA